MFVQQECQYNVLQNLNCQWFKIIPMHANFKYGKGIKCSLVWHNCSKLCVLLKPFIIVSTVFLMLAEVTLIKCCFSICHFLLVGGGSLDSTLLLTFSFYMGQLLTSIYLPSNKLPTFSHHALQQSWMDYHDHGPWALIH